MAGIYIHIPFCKQACHYCNFHFSTNLQFVDDITNAIVQEIVLQKKYLTVPIQTVYFGGGTPSIIGAKRLKQILDQLAITFDCSKVLEYTLEANPDDITTEEVAAWKAIGINRLSIGVQSFEDNDLTWMHRVHNASHAKNCITIAKQSGIDNLSIDLIYGTPGLSNEAWLKNIDTAVQLGVQHLSCYALTVEPDTALEKMILQKKKEPVDANKAAEQMELLMQRATELGFEHYEISNLALPGFRSKHNSAYWQGAHYLGLGPSAHSFNGTTRQWNVANNALYLKSLEQKTVPFEIETLSVNDSYNEYLMTSLRTMEGVDLKKLYAIVDTSSDFKSWVAKYLKQQLAKITATTFVLTTKGRLQADRIACELFID